MREQYLDLKPDGTIELTNKIDLDPVLQSNYLERMNPNNGWSKDRTLRKVASIPVEHLVRDWDGYMFYLMPFGAPETRIAFDNYIKKHPGYKTSK